VDIVGIDNIPRHGPVIFSGNHSNQFVDGLMVMTTAQHRVGFLIAEKSYNHPVVGSFAKLAGAVPVARPQDSAKPMDGLIIVEGRAVTGQGTAFTRDLAAGDKIRLTGQADQYKIEAVASDTALTLSENGPAPPAGPTPPLPYEKLRKVDQSRVYNAVFESLKHGRCIGIFPEGGSHDRTDLLPLKVGIALIAFGMVEKHNITVPIVPVGLNYFRCARALSLSLWLWVCVSVCASVHIHPHQPTTHPNQPTNQPTTPPARGHRFRGRVVVEFGPPIRVPEELAELYKSNRREAYQQVSRRRRKRMMCVLLCLRICLKGWGRKEGCFAVGGGLGGWLIHG
jgi:glycerol-3-phosphate O-acyltransferase / dihydroxyacetone phosphate acyltransferase